jgi:hypothetical protein
MKNLTASIQFKLKQLAAQQQDIDFGAVLTAIRTDLLPIYESLNTNI